MENFLTFIGSIASIVSIPIAIYIYLKSNEQKKETIRREILKTISYQIGENRVLDLFEVDKIIISNLRNNKLAKEAINIKSILEDLISDTVSSPLLDSKRKEDILTNIKDIFPNKDSVEDVKYSTTKLSTIFALTAIFFTGLLIGFVLFIGERGWNKEMDIFFSFGTIKGYKSNLVLSILVGILAVAISLIIFKAHIKTKPSR